VGEFSEVQQSLQSIINLFELEIKGVTIQIREPPEIKGDHLGEYLYFFKIIKIREKIAPFWYATITTLLHEFGHHRQRFQVYLLIILSIILSIISSYNFILFVFVTVPFLVVFLLLQKFHFEQDADNYMVKKIPDIVIYLLSQLEVVEFADSLGSDLLKRSLSKLGKIMTEYFPEFMTES